MTTTHRDNSDLLSELRAAVAERPRLRLHVHPESAMWISMSVQNTGLSEHVEVVPDPACSEVGKGWIERLTTAQWREMLALVGHRATVTASWPEALQGTSLDGVLLALDHGEARLDLGGGDIRYLPWISVGPPAPGADGQSA